MAATNAPASANRALLRRPWVSRLLLVALFAEIGYAVLNISTMPVYLAYNREFGAGLIGAVLVAFLVSETALKGPMGAVADRVGHKRLMAMGAGLTVFTSIATLFVPRFHSPAETFVIIGLRVLDGAGAAMIWPAAFALIGDAVEDRERQQAMSLMNMCYLLGIALALPLGGLANDMLGASLEANFGPRTPGLFVAMFCFLAVTIAAAWPMPLKHRPVASEAETPAPKSLLIGLKAIPQYLTLAIVTFAGVGFPMPVIKLFAEEQFHMTETQFGALVLPGALAMAFLSVPIAKIGERLGRPRAVHWGLGLCSMGTILVAMGAVAPALRAPWVVAAAFIPVGLGFLLTIPAWLASVSDIDPKRRGVYIGAVMTGQGIGAILGALLGPVLFEQLQPIGEAMKIGAELGRYAPFVGCAGCVSLGWVLSLVILRDYRPTSTSG